MGSILKEGKALRIQFYGPLGVEPIHKFKETVQRHPSWDDERYRREAEKYLRKRLRDVENDRSGLKPLVTNFDRKVLVTALIEDLNLHHKNRGNPKAAGTTHLLRYFRGLPALDVIPSILEKYTDVRLGDGAAASTINHEMNTLSKAFDRGIASRQLSSKPKFPRLSEQNVREGFITWSQFLALRSHVESEDIRDFLDWAFQSSFRKGEIGGLEWSNVDFELGQIILPGRKTKNGNPRPVPIIGELKKILLRRQAKRRLDCSLVFHEEGKPIYLRTIHDRVAEVWEKATTEAGMPGLYFHDLRRSGIIAMRRAGISERVIMQISGHVTREVFDRYSIVDHTDLENALLTMEKKYAEAQPNQVIPFPAAQS